MKIAEVISIFAVYCNHYYDDNDIDDKDDNTDESIDNIN
jgi:hypothetical protein